jgi:hypothetical protein
MTELIERHIVDHLNHDDLVGPEGGKEGIPEPPVTGLTYGRGGGVWSPVLDLATRQAQQVNGPILIPSGTRGAPGLMIGDNATGFWRNQTVVYLNIGGGECMAWTPNMAVSWTPLDMGSNGITSLADPAQPQDAVNFRTLAGPWTNLVSDPGWASTLRFRRTGPSLMLDGYAQGALPADAKARIGVLPEGSRPARMARLPAVATLGLAYGWAMLEITPDGGVWTQSAIGAPPSDVVVMASGVFALD